VIKVSNFGVMNNHKKYPGKYIQKFNKLNKNKKNKKTTHQKLNQRFITIVQKGKLKGKVQINPLYNPGTML
jgi:hypothetical protein